MTDCACGEGCGCTADFPPSVLKAAARIHEVIEEAKANNSYMHGWYAYMHRTDVETLMQYVLDTEAAKPVKEPEYTMIVTDLDGNPLFERKINAETLRAMSPPSVAEPEPVQPDYTTGTGQVLTGIHDPSHCEGEGCVIHHPSDHHMKDWPTNWRDGGFGDIKPPHMERICPHGVGHPDPDSLAFFERTRPGEDVISTHGCDGCCRPPTVAKWQPEDHKIDYSQYPPGHAPGTPM